MTLILHFVFFFKLFVLIFIGCFVLAEADSMINLCGQNNWCEDCISAQKECAWCRDEVSLSLNF